MICDFDAHGRFLSLRMVMGFVDLASSDWPAIVRIAIGRIQPDGPRKLLRWTMHSSVDPQYYMRLVCMKKEPNIADLMRMLVLQWHCTR